jgi:macrolide-specific efflux system membrane fusion protein
VYYEIIRINTKTICIRKKVFLSFPAFIRIILTVGIITIAGYWGYTLAHGKNQQPQYQTATAEKGTLVTTVTASGNVASGGTVNITTGVSGTVTQIYVKNGDTVAQGQKIADVTLDRDSQQKQTQAWASYLSAQTSLNNAQTALYTLQSSMFTKWKTYTDKATNTTYQNPDGSANSQNRTLVDFTTTQDDWLAAEATYKNQQNTIAQAQASLTSAWYNYQLLSSTITAPAAGTISNLNVAEGLPITISTSSNSNSNSVTTTTVGTITLPRGGIQAIVDLAEIDAAKVVTGDKATLTLAAFPNKTFTGKVLILNTNGTVSSGVTTYPATIAFDTTEPNIYPNMAVDANIITGVKNDVILIPTSAVQTTSGQSTVRILKNGQISIVNVEIGDANDTQTEIASGINEGDMVITSVVTAKNSQTNSTSSPFSAFGRGGFGGGGGTRVVGR